MKFETLPTTCDLSEVALDYVAIELGVRVCDLRVYASDNSRIEGRRLQGLHGFELIIVPAGMLAHRFAWAAESNGRLVGSQGCD